MNKSNYNSELNIKEIDVLDSSIFNNNNPINIEIGCGYDSFILKMAKKNPEQNFFGIEIDGWVLSRLIERANRLKLPNVRLIRADAKSLLEKHSMFNTINAFYINQPDPWPKKRHRGRRLIKDEFLDFLITRLVEEGKLYYSSDFEDYAYQVAGKLYSTGRMKSIFNDLVSTSFPEYPKTRFMKRFLSQGLPIYFIAMEKIA